MIEAYFEEAKIQNPFECFIADTKGKSFTIGHHWQYYIELLYFIDGCATIFMDDEHFIVGTGDLVLINSREVHSIYSQEGINTRYVVIKFDPEVLYTTTITVFEAKYILPFTMAKYKHQKVFTKEELAGTSLDALIMDILEEYLKKNYGFELAIRTSIGRFFLWVIRDWEKKGVRLELQSIPKEIDIQKLQDLVDYLDKHYAEEISAEEMAKMCSMSYSYFSRFFKKVMRKTFTQYLSLIRIAEAEKLLLTTDMNITEVGLSTGFANSSYFIKQFKHYKSISPKQFKIKTFENRNEGRN